MHIILQKGVAAARENAAPGMLLQGFALTLVLLYYFYPPVKQALSEVPVIKERMGILFPIVVTSFFGGFVPFVFMVVRKDVPAGQHLSVFFFQLGFWAFMGLAVDWLYTIQAAIFGDQADVLTVIKKVCFDQFVFSAFFSAPFSTIAMHWKNCGFSFRETRARFSRKMFTVEVPSVLIAIWAVWIPTVVIVYSLPLALQFPLFNIVLCFWSLLLTALSSK